MKEEDARLRREIEQIPQRAQEIDAAEAREFGPDVRGDELPAELQRRETRRAKIREAMERLEAEAAAHDDASGRGQARPGRLKRPIGVPPASKQMNFTDPESRLMKTASGGFEQCYNAQLAIDAERQIIVAADVTESAAGNGQLGPLEEQAGGETGGRAAPPPAGARDRGEAEVAAPAQRGGR